MWIVGGRLNVSCIFFVDALDGILDSILFDALVDSSQSMLSLIVNMVADSPHDRCYYTWQLIVHMTADILCDR